MEYSNLFVVLMGLCTVFIGLICIIVLVTIMSGIIRKTEKMTDKNTAAGSAPAAAPAAVSAAAGSSGTAGKVTPELVAAVSAVIAEQMGTDVSALRIRSIKKVS